KIHMLKIIKQFIRRDGISPCYWAVILEHYRSPSISTVSIFCPRKPLTCKPYLKNRLLIVFSFFLEVIRIISYELKRPIIIYIEYLVTCSPILSLVHEYSG